MRQIGTRVHSILYGGRTGVVYAIHGEQRPGMVQNMGGIVCTGGNAHFDIVFDNGTISRMLPECILDGVQWLNIPGIAPQKEIDALLTAATLKKAADTEAAERAALDRIDEAARIKRENPQLTQGTDCTTAAANIRKQLAATFPGVKFRVKTSRFSGGNSIDICWTDGPTSAQVEEIAKQYQVGSFDGSTDSYNYDRAVWPEVFGGSKYVSTNRSVSAALVEPIIARLATYYGTIETPTAEQFLSGNAYQVAFTERGWQPYWNWQEALHREIAQTAA